MTVKDIKKENGNVTFTMDTERSVFDAAIVKVYNKEKKNIAIPGFRKGKAPRQIVEAMYGKEIFWEDAINELFPDAFTAAVEENNLKLVGNPSISDFKVTDEALSLTVVSALYPEVELGEYKGLEVEKREPVLNEDSVDDEIKRMQERNARVSTVDRPAQDGDTCVIDFEGFKDGVAFEGGKGENYELKIGSGTFIPGFEEGCIGLSAGETKDLELTFPEDYGAEDLAGQAVVFKVTVHEVKENILPELDDEFAKDVSEFDTLEEYKNSIREKKLAELKEEADLDFKNAALLAAMNNMKVDIPACMVEEELDEVIKQYSNEMRANGMDMNLYYQYMGTTEAQFREMVRPVASDRVKNMLLLEKVAEVENIEVTEEEIEAEYQNAADNYGAKLEIVKKILKNEDMHREVSFRKAGDLIAAAAIAVAPKEKPEEETVEAASEDKPEA